MSGNTPPPEHPESSGGQPQPQPGDTVRFGDGGPRPPMPPGAMEEPPGPGRSHAGKIVAIGAALALVVGGGAFAFVQADPLNLFTPGPQAAEAIPDTALGYFGVDLDPSATQKVEALRFLRHFPDFEDISGIKDEQSDVREAIFDEAIQGSDCDLTFDDDIDPWLGYKFGFAVMPSSDGGTEPEVLVAAEIKDEDEAVDGLDALTKCDAAAPEGPGYAFSGDYVLLAETQELADGYADAVGDRALADDGDFKADMDELGDVGVATAWADVEGIVNEFPDEAGADELPVTGVPDLDMITSTYQRVAATFRFESDHVELVTKVFGDTSEVDHGDNEVTGLPDSTVFAISEAGGGSRLAAAWDDLKQAMESGGTDVDQELSQFEEETGLSIPADIETLLGDNLMVSLDAEGLTSDVLNEIGSSGDLSALNLGIRFKGDDAKLDDLYDRITDLVQGAFPGQLPFEKVDYDDGFVLATNSDYGAELADLDGGLGDSDTFQSVVDDAAGQELVVYFDWDQVEDQVVEGMREAGSSESDIENAKVLRAFGLTSQTEGDYTTYTFQMSVND